MKDPFVAFIVGVLLGTLANLIAHLFSVRRERAKERRYAAAKFRTAFMAELMALGDKPFPVSPDQQPKIILGELLAKAFLKHYEAFLVFKDFLSPKIKPEFDKAWENYCYPDGGTGGRPLSAYGKASATNEMAEKRTINDKDAIKRIKYLISFAKHN